MTGFPDRPEGSGGSGKRGSVRSRPAPGSPPLGIFSSLIVRQPREGYRFSIDSVLLSDFAADYCGERVLDLGTGAGGILLLLAGIRGDLREGVGVEIQEGLWRGGRWG